MLLFMMGFLGVCATPEAEGPSREGIMEKRFLYIGLALVLIGFAYIGYNSYDARRAGGTGDVFSRDSGEKVGTDSGASANVTPSSPTKEADAKPSETGGVATPVLGSAVTQTTPAEAAAGSQVTQMGQSAQVVPEGESISRPILPAQ
jgi:hypothetical protein